jgi:hypothetical protein
MLFSIWSRLTLYAVIRSSKSKSIVSGLRKGQSGDLSEWDNGCDAVGDGTRVKLKLGVLVADIRQPVVEVRVGLKCHTYAIKVFLCIPVTLDTACSRYAFLTQPVHYSFCFRTTIYYANPLPDGPKSRDSDSNGRQFLAE